MKIFASDGKIWRSHLRDAFLPKVLELSARYV